MRPLRILRRSRFALIVIAVVVLLVMWGDWIPQNHSLRLNLYHDSKQQFGKLDLAPILQTSQGPALQTDTISLFLRIGGKNKELRRRFYCIFLRLSVLFWPPSFGKTVVVLDQEIEEDHEFGKTLTSYTEQYFPDRTFQVLYESIPKNPSTLADCPNRPGYNRQLYSSFFIDLYTDDTIIAWMDSDAGFGLPVREESIFNVTKLRVLGYDCTLKNKLVNTWARTTEQALGLPFVADFMTYFPVYIYRDTFTHCREYIMKKFNTTDFDEAFKNFSREHISPVSTILSYAWYFERERYDWNFKICFGLDEHNKRFSAAEHMIKPEDVIDYLLIPQTAFHFKYGSELRPYVSSSYCLSQEAAGNDAEKCSNRTASLMTNFVLFNHDIQRFDRPAPPCPRSREATCLQILERNYNQIGQEIKQKTRKLDWQDVKIVEKIAKELGIKCQNITD